MSNNFQKTMCEPHSIMPINLIHNMVKYVYVVQDSSQTII